MRSMDMVRSEYSAREFNRDPSVISRAARKYGSVRILNRGELSLIVLDAAQHPEFARSESRSLLDSMSRDLGLDDEIIGDPPRMSMTLNRIDE